MGMFMVPGDITIELPIGSGKSRKLKAVIPAISNEIAGIER